MNKTEIKLCPFCGGSAEINRGGFGEMFVTCSDDQCGGRLGCNVWFRDEIKLLRFGTEDRYEP